MVKKMEQLTSIGKIIPKRSLDIKKSKLGIGFEKLDRNVFDPEKAYDKLALVGVKWVRLQSGWQRTERVKGVYDFEWLDKVVDNLIERGMKPWICLCYGNDLYNEEAKTVFGAVGVPPIFTDEQKNGWASYVKATVTHFKDRVDHWEIWNEADGQWCWKHGVNAEEYGNFSIATAKAVHEADKDACVIGGVVCSPGKLDFISTALATGMANEIDAFSFHEYTPSETDLYTHVPALRALCRSYNPKIKIIQGESGSQSRSDGNGALRGGAWTPARQAKQCMRHAIADLSCEVEFTSYFSCMDMIEALNGTVGDLNSYLDYGYFGIIGADFDENGFSTGAYTPKPAYYAYQNVCSVFAEDVDHVELPILRSTLPSKRMLGSDYSGPLTMHGFRKPNGSSALAFWNPTALMQVGEFEATVSFRAANLHGDIRLVDLMDGAVYSLNPDQIEQSGDYILLKNVPVKDYPLLLTFGSFADFE